MTHKLLHLFNQFFSEKQFDKRYTILNKLGVGGQGEAILVEHKFLRAKFVAKLLTPGRNIRRFKREAKLMVQLKHPYIVPIADFIEEPPNDYYIIMPYAEYGMLYDLMSLCPNNRLSIQQIITIGRQVCEALDTVHSKEIIHRDIKPANILVYHYQDKNNLRVWLSDFGIALAEEHTRLTRDDVSFGLGTRDYMAPEQHYGDYTNQTDIYALGAVLYELLAGKLKPLKDYRISKYERIESPQRYRPQTPGWLEKVVLKALSRDPTKRFSSAKDFYQALSQPTDNEIDNTRPPTVSPAPVVDQITPISDPDMRPCLWESPGLSSEPPATTSALIWEYDGEAAILSAPVMDMDCLYVCNMKGKLIAIPHDYHIHNSPRWTIELPTSVRGNLAISRGWLLIPGCNGTLYQVGLTTGKLEKEYHIGGLLSTAPRVIDKVAYVVSDMPDDFSEGAGKLAAINVIRKEFDIAPRLISKLGFAVQPNVLGGKIYLGGKGHNEANIYTVPVNGGSLKKFATVNRSVNCMVADSHSKLLYIANLNGEIITLSTKGKVNVIRNMRDSVPIVMKVAHDKLYVGTGYKGQVYALNVNTRLFGRKQNQAWRYDTAAPVRQILTTTERYVYVLDEAGYINALTDRGQLIWHWRENNQLWTAMRATNMDRLYLTSKSGRIAAISPQI